MTWVSYIGFRTQLCICAALLYASFSLPLRAQHTEAAQPPASLPVGLYLPVQIPHALHAGKTKPGALIVAHIVQRVPLTAGTYLAKADLLGEVVVSTRTQKSTSKVSVLSIRFSQLRYRGRLIVLRTRAIAIANFTDVDDTAVLVTGSTDRGNSNAANWTTRQVGGDEVYRSGWSGPVCDYGMRTVGSADYYGVYTLPQKLNAHDNLEIPRALGAFSTTARGLYGFDEGSTLTSNGDGSITITGRGKNLAVRAGDELLLEVVPPSPL